MASDRKAVRYLAASGATALTIRDGRRPVLHVGHRTNIECIGCWWLPQEKAAKVGRKARTLAGPSPDAARLVEAVHAAAKSNGVTLTEHATAITRAAESAQRLDAAMAELNTSGALRAFNQVYRAKREAATAAGHGFIGYGYALGRLRKALVPVLAEGRDPMATAPSLFASIFR